MRKFSSYGQIDTELHYYAPRETLIDEAYTQLVGENPEKGGHYITVWAPRQTGKSSVMLEVTKRLRKNENFDVALITMQSAKNVHTNEGIIELFLKELQYPLERKLPPITTWKELPEIFTSTYLARPLILIIDEFDAIDEEFINSFANEFRKMHTARLSEADKKSHEKQYLLHGLALIGVRSVLGIEHVTGSPFNVQRSLHIPNLTFEEVEGMYKWYEQESGHHIESNVIERLYYETNGQPGLTCWLGELLTEGFEDYRIDRNRPITMEQFNYVFMWAIQGLPNNNILNIISKAKQPLYKETVLELFETAEKREFRYDDPELNFLYMNGVIDIEATPNSLYVKFPSPFVHKRLFNYFSSQLFKEMGRLVEPFDSLEDAITTEHLHLPNLIIRYQQYLNQNRDWLFKNAPRRIDLRITEAVYHFNFYMYLHKLLHRRGARVWPEFPTGNGKLDILIKYRSQQYGVEVKSFSTIADYNEALGQAASYASQLSLNEITLVFFIEAIDEDNRDKYEAAYVDKPTGVTVKPVFVETGI